jgi:AraC-like DNA-binding protein
MRLQSSHLLERSGVEGTYALESVKWAQLEPGVFTVRYGVLEACPVELSVRCMNVGFSAEAAVAPNKLVFGLIADTRTRARRFGIQVDECNIAASRDSMVLSAEGPSSFYTVSVDERSLQEQFPNAPDALDLMENVQTKKLARDPIQARRLRAWMRRLFSAGQPQMTLQAAAAGRSVYGTLIPLLASAIGNDNVHTIEPSKCLTRRLSAVRACETYMHEHVDATLTLLDLSEVSGMRSRSLINAFEAITGFSPMDYLKRLRLSGVRRTLQGANKPRTRIIDVATDWGFWHMGHFTADYRAMFGETPSQTLIAS